MSIMRLATIGHHLPEEIVVGALLKQRLQGHSVDRHGSVSWLRLSVATRANRDSDHDRFPLGAAVDALGKRLHAALLSGRPTGLPPRNAAAPPPTPRPGTDGFSRGTRRVLGEVSSRPSLEPQAAPGLATGDLGALPENAARDRSDSRNRPIPPPHSDAFKDALMRRNGSEYRMGVAGVD